MPRNQKLTRVVAGRTVKLATTESGAVSTLFEDGSNMKIKTATDATVSPRGKVTAIHETKDEFKIEFEDGSSTTFCLADPGSSIVVREKNHAVEYLG